MKLIGVAGAKRSGKNTFADLLAAREENVTRVAFADKLKLFAARALGFRGTDEFLIALMDEFKETGELAAGYRQPGADGSILLNMTGRQYLQWVGTEAGRNTFGDTFWIDQVLPDPVKFDGADWQTLIEGEFYERYGWEVDYVVVTDVRFPNEAQRIRDLGGVVVEIQRDGAGGDGHVSETPLPREMVDYVVTNDGTMEDLSDEVDVFLGWLGA